HDYNHNHELHNNHNTLLDMGRLDDNHNHLLFNHNILHPRLQFHLHSDEHLQTQPRHHNHILHHRNHNDEFQLDVQHTRRSCCHVHRRRDQTRLGLRSRLDDRCRRGSRRSGL
ncbi:hypothetical protein LTR40_013823, partial [Exophiala xenobiotica]